jgi:16S rRNA (guanine527-N7)-methyltransferase
MKGRAPTEELADLPTEWRLADLQPIEVPGLEAQRHLLRLESVAARREELPS